MKKIISVIILCLIVAVSFIACSGTTPPGACWADKETITYTVTNVNNEVVGTLTSVLERNPADKDVSGTEYANATSRLTLNYVSGSENFQVESLLNDFAPLASGKNIITANATYSVNSYFSGKYYNYTLNQNGANTTDKIKVKTEYIDNELIYTYLRCYDLASGISKTLYIPDALSGMNQSITAASDGTETLSIDFLSGNKSVDCYKVILSRNETPIGRGITVYYAAENDANTVTGGLLSQHDSTKYPVKIIENDLTYTIASITVI